MWKDVQVGKKLCTKQKPDPNKANANNRELLNLSGIKTTKISKTKEEINAVTIDPSKPESKDLKPNIITVKQKSTHRLEKKLRFYDKE